MDKETKRRLDREYYHEKVKSNPGRMLKVNKARKSYRQTLKADVLNAYSNGFCCCASCGISDLRVLSLDHVNDDGAEHRRKVGREALYEYLKKNKYPNDPPLQVLCMNCQFIKRSSLPPEFSPVKIPHELRLTKHANNIYKKHIAGKRYYFYGTKTEARKQLLELYAKLYP